MVRCYGGGVLMGIAASIALVGNGRIAGIGGIVGRTFAREGQAFHRAFVAGLVITGLLAAVIAPSAIGTQVRGIPLLALSGLILGVGQSLANGCTTGHGMCGISRGSPRSFLSVATFIATGAITVAIVGAHP